MPLDLKEIPVSYYEAARIDGARGYQTFFRITLPCLSPIILYNLIMQTISAFMAFTQAMIITNGGPNNSTMLYALYVYNQAFKYNDMGYACAMSWFYAGGYGPYHVHHLQNIQVLGVQRSKLSREGEYGYA